MDWAGFGGNKAQKLRTEHTYISSASCYFSEENRMQWKGIGFGRLI